jgi:hypothetical protein
VLDRLFHLSENVRLSDRGLAGLTTFLTMAYIVFVQPAVLSAAGMDFGAVMVATCLATAIATTLMALLANYPIAVAPAMGHNFFFAYSVVAGMKVSWQVALGAVAIAGVVFVLTAGVGLRERVITAIPPSLKHAIAAGIGLLIAMVGLQWAGLIVASPGTLVTLGNLHSRPVVVALVGSASPPPRWRVASPGAVGSLASAAAGFRWASCSVTDCQPAAVARADVHATRRRWRARAGHDPSRLRVLLPCVVRLHRHARRRGQQAG